MKVEIRNPAALWHEIGELICTHSCIVEDISFMEKYPEVYRLYSTLRLESNEVKQVPR